MKEMKRIVSLVLCLVMVVGLVPMSVFAAETPLAAAIFASDIHEESTSLTGSGTSAMKSVLAKIGTNGVTYNTIGFVGDTYTDIAGSEADMTSAAQTALGQNAGVYYAWGDHDAKSDISSESGLLYSGDYHYIYHISDEDMRSKAGATATNVESAISAFETAAASMDKSKVLFIMSHVPLHDRRDDNTYANDWYTAIKAVADTMEVVVFWAHNHTGENEVDQAAYYVARDGSETITIYGGDTVTPNFTYMNAGYIYAAGQNPSRKGVATTVEIYADSLVFQDYSASGEYTDSSYSHNVTVTREFKATTTPTLSSIAIAGSNSYYVGDELDLTVTATYSDGTTADVTAASTITGYDMNTAGTYTVKAEYEGMTAEYTITVSAPSITSVALTSAPTKLTYTVGEELDTTGMVVTATYSDGTTADVTAKAILSGYDMNTLGTQTVKVSVSDNGTVFNNMSFTINVEEAVAEGVTLTGIEITEEPEKTEYLVGQSLNIDGLTVVATFSDGSTKTLEYKPFSTSAVYGGYELDDFNMHVEKAHNAIVSYTFGENTFTDTFVVNVWNVTFADDDSGVTVKLDVNGADYGVTAVNADPSSNSNVSLAIKDVIKAPMVAYDISLALDADVNEDGEAVYALTDGEKTVTLPIPDGVDNPVVYYVSDDGATVTNMNAQKDSNGNVTFTTTHFSTYVVGEDAVTVYESDATVPETTTTTTTYTAEEVTVYKLVTTPESGKQYLIVNSNTGTGYGLDADTTGYATTQFTGGDGYYSSWNSETNSGTAFAAGSDVYLSTSGAYLWTAGSNTFTIGYTQTDNGGDWGWLSGGTYSYTLNPAGDGGEWTVTNNQLKINLKASYTGMAGGSDSNADYYLANSGSAWSMGTSGSNVYFYEPVTVYKVTTSTETVTIPEAVYHMDLTVDGNAVTDHAYTVTGVVNGTTAAMWANFTATTADGTSTAIDRPADGSFTVLSSSNEAVATMGADGVLTFTGVEGQTVVQVEYTWTVDGVEYKTQNYVVITAVAPNYAMSITDPESAQIKIGVNTSLSAVATVNGTEIEDAVITWSSSDETVATVDASTGVVTAKAAGTVTITATWTDPKGVVHTDDVTLEAVDAVYSLDLCQAVYTEVDPDADFDSSVTYFIKQEDGSYLAATGITEFADGVTYYTQSTNSIIAPIVVKDVVENQQYTNIWAVIYADGVDLGKLDDEQLTKLTYISSNTNIATVDKTTGVLTFQGGTGTVTITAMYEYADGKFVTDTAVFSVSDDHYYVPEDGTDDFPEYPNEGAIRFDKTATAVGNFSQTGIAKVELSMTGVPYTTGSEIDVVVMLDMTGSMSDNGMEAAEEATKAFVKTIVKNEDGSYNDNRVAVYAFNSGDSSPYELVALTKISSDTELETANTAIDTASDKQASGGTPFDEAAKKCYDVLQAAKTDGTGDDRQQFCVFMSDGGPTTYYGSDEKTYYGGNNNSGDVLLTSCFTGYDSSTASDWTFSLPSEYYTDAMKADGVTVYTVGLLLQTAPSNPAPYSSMTDSTYDSTTDSLTTIGSHYFFTSSILKQMATDESKYIDIFNVDNADKATAAFTNIARAILDAAKDVKVTDKIADEFTMVFEAPNDTVKGELPEGQEFYIEVLDYELTPVYDTDGTTIIDYTRGTATSKIKVYLGTNGNNYYAASDASGTAHATPAFDTTALGTLYYWTTDSTLGDSGVSVVGADGTTYYFISTGKGTHNMVSGAYASGTKTTESSTTSDGDTVSSTTSQDLIIATPYFVYNASTRMLVWTAEKLNSSELALSYFLYLDESGGWSGAEGEADAGTYETNDYANLNYTNFQGTECEQEFPVPQITWNGAQVSYVFYLVNDQGQPVNRAGRVVPFSEAVYVTDVFTYAIVWNDLEQVASLEAVYLAKDLVPEVYSLYDEVATYNIHVFEDEAAQNLNNHFVIGGDTNTTHVFNTKADATKYTVPATYAATSTYLCKDYDVNVNGNEVEYLGDKEQYKENGVAVVGADDKGAYAIVYNTGATVVHTGFDFSNTTVAFAVMWTPQLVEDTVVVDYGLDVVIDVTTNDALASGVVGVRADAPSGVAINEGTYDAAKAVTTDLYIDANDDESNLKELKIGTATVESLTSVRVSLDKSNGMQFADPVTFYYESDVNYYATGDTNLTTTSMYSSVTVIPATTIYYEDEFLTFTSVDGSTGVAVLSSGEAATAGQWYQDGTAINADQAADRPGASKISEAYDADNVYGYDAAYATCSKYSLGSAAKVTVDADTYASASFTFYGTGFDIVGLTSNTTGILMLTVTDENGKQIGTRAVDTYYGYAYSDADGWYVTDSDDVNALYQIPVLQVNDLAYGKYTATLKATYFGVLDNTGNNAYDLYIDAVRIYDPAGKTSSTEEEIKNAYVKDEEGWPIYEELRNNVISAADFTSGTINGVAFIDGSSETASVMDYASFGPNNELYLGAGQAIVFNLDLANYVDLDKIASVHLGIKSANENSVEYVIVDGATLSDKADLTDAAAATVATATDMYYDITALKDKTIVIYNSGTSGILSLTNIKITFTEDPGDLGTLFYVDYDAVSKILSNMAKESATADPENSTTGFAPSITVRTDDTAYEGEKVVITVVTSTDVSYVTVDDNKITDNTTGGETLTWTYEYTANDEDKDGEEYVTVIAYNASNVPSDPVSIQVEVLQYYTPNVFTAEVSESTAKVGEAVTVTVTTSKEVSAVTVNGSIIKCETSGDNLIWTTDLTMAETGTETIEVIAYNENGVASEPKTLEVTVSDTASSTQATIQSLISTILSKISQWFNWNR